MLKHSVGIILSFFFYNSTIAQVESEIYFGECCAIIVNDYVGTPQLDTLLSHFNYKLDDIMNYNNVDVMRVSDFTCVKSYEVVYNDTIQVIRFNEPDFHCYEIGWSKVSLLHVNYFDDSCGINSLTLYMFP
jgi:hypothetical protein